MKHYKKFYEIGNNRYYTINADDETFIATESFINVGKKKLFRKQDYITQGLKLLKFNSPIAILFNALENIPKIKGQKGVHKDMLKYEIINNDTLKDEIIKYYDLAYDEQIKDLDDWLSNMKKEVTASVTINGKLDTKLYKEKMKNFTNRYDSIVSQINKRNPIINGTINLKNPADTGCLTIKSMLKSGLNHLYTERVTAFADNVFLYEQDCFGTITIYRVMTIKNIVKCIDTFIYDKNVVGTLLKTMYENN